MFHEVNVIISAEALDITTKNAVKKHLTSNFGSYEPDGNAEPCCGTLPEKGIKTR